MRDSAKDRIRYGSAPSRRPCISCRTGSLRAISSFGLAEAGFVGEAVCMADLAQQSGDSRSMLQTHTVSGCPIQSTGNSLQEQKRKSEIPRDARRGDHPRRRARAEATMGEFLRRPMRRLRWPAACVERKPRKLLCVAVFARCLGGEQARAAVGNESLDVREKCLG